VVLGVGPPEKVVAKEFNPGFQRIVSGPAQAQDSLTPVFLSG
jgi:hypothetical protein